eukprot:scaffold54377_cov66-Phaeocystis_antarctica.AAC.2
MHRCTPIHSAHLPASAGRVLRGGPPLGGDALPALRLVQRVRALLRARPAQLRIRGDVARRRRARPPHPPQAALVGDRVQGYDGLLWRDKGGRRHDRQPPPAYRGTGVALVQVKQIKHMSREISQALPLFVDSSRPPGRL